MGNDLSFFFFLSFFLSFFLLFFLYYVEKSFSQGCTSAGGPEKKTRKISGTKKALAPVKEVCLEELRIFFPYIPGEGKVVDKVLAYVCRLGLRI